MESGTIVEYHRDSYLVILDGSQMEVPARVRVWEMLEDRRQRQESSLDGELVFARQLAVGDRVEVQDTADGHFLIDGILPRQSYLMRRGVYNYAHQYQLVVANADQLAVVASPNPRIKPALIDRYMLAGIKGGLEPLLVVNKIDTDGSLLESEDLLAYRELGYRVIFTSALRGDGMDALAAALAGRFTAFCGQSGVGKSTLLAALTGEEIATGVTKRRMGTGRQTTVSSRLYALPGGGHVVDTPGIRVFGLAGLTTEDVRGFFTDISRWAVQCQFADCTHSHEPGCRVKDAMADGELTPLRLDSYVKLFKEVEQLARERTRA